MAKILLTGATGLIGGALGQSLVKNGHEVFIISRKSPEVAQKEVPFFCQAIQCDLSTQIPTSSLLKEVEGVIHLAGESVAGGRWTKKYKQKLVDSRVASTRNLLAAFVVQKATALKFYIGASAVGYYGNRSNEVLDEESSAGQGFLSELTQKWEAEHLKWGQTFSQIRSTILRLGVVHSPVGGALGQVIPIFKMGFGSPLGNGKQWVSWVDIQDVVGVCGWLLEQSNWKPHYNVVAPDPVTNEEWSRQIARVLNSALLPKVPTPILKIALGQKSQVLLDSQKVYPKNLLAEGYKFIHSTAKSSLDVVGAFYSGAHHIYYAQQFLPNPISEVFPFFSEAKNLERITPPFMNFKIQKMSTPHIQKGTLIDYRLKIRGVPVGWRTEITTWDPPHAFADVQLKGPYAQWYHTHLFEAVPGGTLMSDIVRFKLPMFKLGDWFGYAYVKSEVAQIFKFRRKIVGEVFGGSGKKT